MNNTLDLSSIPPSKLLSDQPESKIAMLRLVKELTGQTNLTNLISCAEKLQTYLKNNNDIDSVGDYDTSAHNPISNSLIYVEDDIKKAQSSAIDMLEVFRISSCESNDGSIDFILRNYQKELIKSAEENRTLIISSARQMGNSILFGLYAAVKAITNKENTLIIYPRFSQIQDIINELYDSIIEYNFHALSKKTHFELEFMNGAKITFKTADQVKTPQQEDRVILFDAAYIPFAYDEVLWKNLIGMYASKKMIVISTPNIKKGLFWSLYNDFPFDEKIELQWWKDTGSKKREAVSKIKKLMDNDKFENEFECKFLDKI